MKHQKDLEKIVKGFSNHRRIEILTLLEKNPGLSLFDIADRLNANFKTISEHTRRLVIAGLVLKKYKGKSIQHTVSSRGYIILRFLRMLE